LQTFVFPEVFFRMDNWILRIELDGEWEECAFATPKEALSAFAALAKDYERNLKRAVLCPEPLSPRQSLEEIDLGSRCVN
jgi:hypothetical protein